MLMFLIGGYVVGVVLTFLVLIFLHAIGGESKFWWKPFVYSLIWPIVVPWIIFDYRSSV